MKAKILLTGEIVDVSYIGQRGTGMTNMYIDSFNRTYAEYELEFLTEELLDNKKNWQDVRERAAIAAMQAMITNDEMLKAKVEAAMNISSLPSKEVARTAVLFANELVKQLKGE